MPPNTTKSPFTSGQRKQPPPQQADSRKRSFEEMERNSALQGSRALLNFSFSWVLCLTTVKTTDLFQNVPKSQPDQGRNKRQKRDELKEDHPLLKRMAGCWFCLSNPEVEKHLIVSIGEECYLSLAKGGLTPHHTLIIPIAHASSTLQLEDATRTEIDRYKQALRKCFDTQQMGVIFIEQNLPTMHGNVHCVIQVAPVPQDLGTRSQEFFSVVASELDMELAQLEATETLASAAGKNHYVCSSSSGFVFVCLTCAHSNFVDAELPDGTRLIHIVRAAGRRVPIQFSRRVLARLFGDRSREDWKACTQPTATETQYCKAMKDLFKPYDFTLQ